MASRFMFLFSRTFIKNDVMIIIFFSLKDEHVIYKYHQHLGANNRRDLWRERHYKSTAFELGLAFQPEIDV